MNTRECLALLNLDSAATGKDLKLAYRKAVKQWHPDRYQQASEQSRSTAELQMQTLNTAYAILSEYYDKHGFLPGYISPEHETESVVDFTSETNQPATRYQQESQSQAPEAGTTASDSAWGDARHTTPPPAKAQQGKFWILGGIVFVVAFYSFSDMLTDSNEESDIVAQDARNYELANNPSSEAQQKKPADEMEITEDEENESPFASKERKSAFEQTSRLGIYEEPADEKYFTHGDTAGRVFEIQGVPTRTVGDIWYYGMSEVHFQDGRVKSWLHSEGNRLKARKR